MEQQQEDRFVDELNMVSKTNIVMHETVDRLASFTWFTI